MADFCIVGRRSLDEMERQVFRNHYLLGASWKACCSQMKIDRGSFFHFCYRIESKLGEVFAELQPYALYPVDEYFGGLYRGKRRRPLDRELKGSTGDTDPLVILPLSA